MSDSNTFYLVCDKEIRECTRCPKDKPGNPLGVARNHAKAVSLAMNFVDRYFSMTDEGMKQAQDALTEHSKFEYGETGYLHIMEMVVNKPIV